MVTLVGLADGVLAERHSYLAHLIFCLLQQIVLKCTDAFLSGVSAFGSERTDLDVTDSYCS